MCAHARNAHAARGETWREWKARMHVQEFYYHWKCGVQNAYCDNNQTLRVCTREKCRLSTRRPIARTSLKHVRLSFELQTIDDWHKSKLSTVGCFRVSASILFCRSSCCFSALTSRKPLHVQLLEISIPANQVSAKMITTLQAQFTWYAPVDTPWFAAWTSCR